jgi:uncharacterized RDD family membrane protein YckC
VARLLDSMIIGVGTLLVAALTGNRSLDTLRASSAYGIAVFAVAVAYEVWFVSQTGQTLGKRLLSVQVVDADTGAVPAPAQAFRRVVPVLVQLVPVIGIIGPFLYLPALWHPRRQGVHDRIANTVVIDRRALPTN